MILPLMWEIYNLFALTFTNLVISTPIHFLFPLVAVQEESPLLHKANPFTSSESHPSPPALIGRRQNLIDILFTSHFHFIFYTIGCSELLELLFSLHFCDLLHTLLVSFVLYFPSPKSSLLVSST